MEVGRTLVGVSVTLEAIVFAYSTLFFKTDISFFRIFASRQLVFVLHFRL